MPGRCSNGSKAHTNLNAEAHIDEAKLLEDAREVDRARVRGAQLGPLAGLPIIIKDNVNTVGFPTTAGTPFLKGYRPKTNAPLADMLFKQGAILFAKSNMHELALGGTSANPTFGLAANPHDLTQHPGRLRAADHCGQLLRRASFPRGSAAIPHRLRSYAVAFLRGPRDFAPQTRPFVATSSFRADRHRAACNLTL